MKFGGTSVEDAAAIGNVSRIIADRFELRPVVVVSAMGGMTDVLLASVEQAWEGKPENGQETLKGHFQRHLNVVENLLSDEADSLALLIQQAQREIGELLQSVSLRPASRPLLQDSIVSFGERLSSELIAASLRTLNVPSEKVDARRCLITDDNYGCAKPLIKETNQRTREYLEPLIAKSIVPVLGGFIGSTLGGETTTLGRGGSDYSASIIGAAIGAKEIQIWTDVTGVLTADPRVAPRARSIPRLSYAEAAELAYFGAKVLHPKTIQPAVETQIPVRICNSRDPTQPGTVIGLETETAPQTVKSIAHKKGVTVVQITSAGMLGAYGFLRELFEVFNRHRKEVDVVTTSEVSVSLTLDDKSGLETIVSELERLGTVAVELERAIICVVGEGLRGTPGIAGRIFSTINDINVSLISQGASRINLTFVIEEDRVAETVTRLHEAFFSEGG